MAKMTVATSRASTRVIVAVIGVALLVLMCHTTSGTDRVVPCLLACFREGDQTMQEVVASFTTVMTWLILLLSSLAVLLLGLAAWHLPAHRCRALVGVLGMALVLAVTAVSLLLLAAHHPQRGPLLSQLLLPLVAPL